MMTIPAIITIDAEDGDNHNDLELDMQLFEAMKVDRPQRTASPRLMPTPPLYYENKQELQEYQRQLESQALEAHRKLITAEPGSAQRRKATREEKIALSALQHFDRKQKNARTRTTYTKNILKLEKHIWAFFSERDPAKGECRSTRAKDTPRLCEWV